jgi:glycine/D-amino acid oxidase-like deaminating enzyme
MEKKIDECEVAIIGGGLIGCFIAYHLSRSGKKIIIIEREDICSGASGATNAVLMAQARKAGPQLMVAMQSLKMWEALLDELDCEIEYTQKGSLIITETEEEVHFVREYSEAQIKCGLPIEFLDREELHELQPNLSPHILGASFCPIDAEVYPFSVAFALLRSIRLHGGRVYTHTPVQGFHLEAGHIGHVITNRGLIKASKVVSAAGPYSQQIGDMLGIEIPIEPQRGQMMVTEPVAPLIGPYMMAARAMTEKQKVASLISEKNLGTFGLGMIITQSVNGNMIVGTTYEFVDYDKRTTLDGLRAIADYTSSILPALKGLNVIRTFSGLRPFPKAGSSIIGPSNRIPNLIIVAGQNGGGVTTAPATSQEVARRLCDGTWS